MTHMLDIQGLTKRFGSLVAVDNITFQVDRGAVLGFLGPNAAGKTTTMRMITGFLPPSAGRAMVGGYDVVEKPIEVKRRIGYLPEGAPLYEDMTPVGFLSFVAGTRGITGTARRMAIDRAAEHLQLAEVLHQPIGTLSKGFKRRVGLAHAILHDPDVLILDEPTDGLDPNQKHDVRRLINRMAAEKVIVISTHLLEEVTAVCTRAIIIARGRLVADATPEELLAMSAYHNAVSVRLRASELDRARAIFARLPGVKNIEIAETTDGLAAMTVVPSNGAEIVNVVSTAARGFELAEIRVESGRLDEVFRRITTGQ
jgi:ABC-2 type transport system ATP-binding protein